MSKIYICPVHGFNTELCEKSRKDEDGTCKVFYKNHIREKNI